MNNKVFYHVDRVEDILDKQLANPVTCEVDPSNRCQLNCSFCMYKKYLKKDWVDLPLEVFDQLLVDLEDMGCKSITFTGGGEPLIHPHINTMVARAVGRGFEVGLVTNGVGLMNLVSPQLFKFIRISLDAASPDVYARVKGAPLFNRVIANVIELVENVAGFDTTVGLSYVVTKENEKDIGLAKALKEQLAVDYIQFKPAIGNGRLACHTRLPGELTSKGVIATDRYKAENDLPCKIAGLVGIVAATGQVYYCCQKRGEKDYALGSLLEGSFPEIWQRRFQLLPEYEKCPVCRYMNYARGFEEFLEGKDIYFKHRNFM